jgi:hypothetical protein
MTRPSFPALFGYLFSLTVFSTAAGEILSHYRFAIALGNRVYPVDMPLVVMIAVCVFSVWVVLEARRKMP